MYAPTLVYWSGAVRSDTPFKRFLNGLGVEYSKLTNARYDGVDNVYFKLTPNKYTYTSSEPTSIVSDLNGVFNIGDEFELYVHYTGESKRVVPNHYTLRAGKPIGSTDIKDYTIDKDAVRATLESDPLKYFANVSLQSAGSLNTSAINNIRGSKVLNGLAIRTTPKPTPVTVVERNEDTTHIYATLALLDNGSMFQKQGISSEMVTVKKSSDTMVWYEYSYKVKYKVVALATTSSYIVNQIKTVGDAIETSVKATKGNLMLLSNQALDTKLKEAVFEMNNVDSIGLTYNGRLRVDAVANMKRLEFSKMLGKILGTGYTKKDVKWYEKALAIVIVIVAVVIGVVTAGGGVAVTSSLMSASIALATASAVATIGMILYSLAFPYATDQAKTIGGFAQVTGLLATVTGLYAAIQQSWEKYLAQESAKEIAKGATEEQAVQIVAREASVGGYINYLYDSAVSSLQTQITSMSDKFTSFFDALTTPSGWSDSLSGSTFNINVSGWLSNLDTGLKLYMKFFGEKMPDNSAESDQAVKQDGVEPLLTTMGMLDELDALSRLDYMINDNLGGQKTENFMTKIY